ncbi:MAG: (2Fe-2S)-binding protein [Gammaproteobacteria bacterium]|jgi:ferric iron reductase protein FhuF|uniref:IucA/IucC family C-terminal-domain containing protein n=1 Tax=Marinomonas TaxID=28253 RepID=UPI000C1F7131|nr:IucA/IucC family C-terminal-domain containing protein [Marinomonas sp. BSi20584]MBU1294880.1 (2Fe-2S)-binding protein [Gammaproteobacteria bacterium]MBU1468299.1 (2Fe-2S)-binding protein [Gammaproteobacteria bacterium]MBU2239629.1 (2Fe-2S)-binding protein [Gammaproteobacteria bacterium]MBU2320865.1 (2Fe-2S)-binding protein [Gammaproteobacteria bacterium]MBU2411961.1 (2Fe-2S)-binding protein [Gammaproteobacteria bacterium]|tara:strand:+ start:14299 stop:15105 length:807 start_codon:yes stop_codon:yes gene_type:complete
MFERDNKHDLLAEEWEVLAAFGLKLYQEDEPLAIDSSKLLDDDLCLETLHNIMPELGAPNLKVTASLVIKRVAFLTLAPVLYAMSSFDKGLDASLENSVFEYPLENKMWLSKMPLKMTEVSVWKGSDKEDRNAWRNEILSKVFLGHLTLLVEQFYRLTKVSRRILWENVAVRVFSIYEQRILVNVVEEMRSKAQADYAYLLDKSTTDLFGLNENPLTAFYRDKQLTALSENPIRVRRTCCFYYQATEPPVYCGSCPLPFKKLNSPLKK